LAKWLNHFAAAQPLLSSAEGIPWYTVLVLAIDTSTPAVTAGLATLAGADVSVLAERVTINPRAHGELITPHVLDAAKEAGVALREVDAIACGVGPGPFTGLRAGMATAAALAHGLGINAYPVCSLDAIAVTTTVGEPFLVATDARRREVYWAAYDANGVRTDGPHVQSPEPLGLSVAAGDGARLYAEKLGVRVLEPYYPTVAGLVTAAREAFDADPAPLTPLYLRRPDAVEPGARKRVTA
jgi:tRNA threonylcarbamoyl adenosine modification protein YeaZ